MGEVAEKGKQELAHREPSTLQILLNDPKRLKEIPIDTVKELISLQIAHRKEEARIGFARAFTSIQSEMEPVRAEGKNLHTKSRYAKLEDVIGMLSPILAKHGMNYSVSSEPSEQKDHTIFVLTLRHNEGHVETHRLDAPLDYVGMGGKTNKTRLQGLASSYTYCERHLLCKVFGVQVVEDDDGNAAGNIGPSADPVSTDQSIILRDLLKDTGGDEKKFLDYFQIDTVGDLPANQFNRAQSMLKSKMKK